MTRRVWNRAKERDQTEVWEGKKKREREGETERERGKEREREKESGEKSHERSAREWGKKQGAQRGPKAVDSRLLLKLA